MKKLTGIIAILLFVFTASAYADGIKCDSASEADEYFAHGEKALAWDCIEKVIKTKPDARAHYMKGKFALLGGDLAMAKTKFSADDVRAKFSEEIFQLYKSSGDKNIANGNFTTAGDMYIEAVSYKAAVKVQIANEMFELGKKSARRGYFDIAKRLDDTLGAKIADHIYSQGQTEKTTAKKIEAIGVASQFDKRYEREYQQKSEEEGRGHLELAKKYAKQVGKDALAAKEKTEAKRWLGEAVVEKELPEMVEYAPNSEKYFFSLAKGEQTSHWVKIDAFKIAFFAEYACQFDAVYDDGYIAKDGERHGMNQTMKFKIRANSDCTKNNHIGLLVK